MYNEIHTSKGIVVSFDEYIHRAAIKIETIYIAPRPFPLSPLRHPPCMFPPQVAINLLSIMIDLDSSRASCKRSHAVSFCIWLVFGGGEHRSALCLLLCY